MNHNDSPAPPAAIFVTFVNGYTIRRLCAAYLPTLPSPGDLVYLDTLGYQVTGHDWYLTPDGQMHINVILQPQIDASGERPFFYPEEAALWERWRPQTVPSVMEELGKTPTPAAPSDSPPES